jgi:exopolyphosphatase/guanosine-5'-triphosphate,3'-diphosphate pyrophosphatase
MQQPDSRIAVLDIGTNTCLMLIAGMDDGKPKKILDLLESPRLGEGIKQTGMISPEALKRTAKVIKNYNKIAHKNKVDRVFAFGTSPFRDAKNIDDVLDYFYKKVDLEIEVFSGESEARFGFYGGVFDLPEGDYAVIDIGGGSTEVSFFENSDFFFKSIDFGSVKGKEMFFTEQGIKDKAEEYIDTMWNDIGVDAMADKTLVGLAGTPTVLAAMSKGLPDFDENKIHRTVLSFDEVSTITGKLLSMGEQEILKLGSIMEGREDIVKPGAMILNSFMKKFNFSRIIVSTKGTRYGVFMYLLKS